jgi:Holliday junction resolvasome RuvABC DNA-binding subunit
MSKSNTQVKVPVAEVTAELVAGHDNTSKKIRYLNSLGYSNGEIEKIFQNIGVTTKTGSPIRYQHIRNVLITPLTNTK